MQDQILAAGLYLVSTPIGNLEDITLRALKVLRAADKIACEDTRQTQKLLNHFEIRTPTISYHLFNEAGRSQELLAELKAGAIIAIVSDAGTPGIADPGTQLVRAAIAAEIDVFPIPGANAALSALVASGLNTDSFTFHGFLAAKAGQRRTQLEALNEQVQAAGSSTHIFYETPHRIVEAIADMETIFGGDQHLVIAREITKLHEEFLRGSVSDLRRKLEARPSLRGEMVLLFAVDRKETTNPSSVAELTASLVRTEGLSEKDALKRVAREKNISKSDAYRELQRTKSRSLKQTSAKIAAKIEPVF